VIIKLNYNSCYIIASFFLGRFEEISYYADKIYSMMEQDLYKLRWLTLYLDEAYLYMQMKKQM